jgi:UDP-2,4-diacetamido-2,4,6-trideoxy-beta-L-altropyranose hydrolase
MMLVIRADASTTIGTGHIMRCIALAQAWQDQGGQVIFLLAHKPSALENKLRSQGVQIIYLSVEAGSDEDAHQTADFIQQFTSQWLVVDGYHFGAEYQRIIKNFGINLLFIDDYGHADHYYADLVLNQNISANQELYINRETYTKLLLGTEYTLLRHEFWQWRDWQREVNQIASKILITLGGSDPDNVTLKVIQALNRFNRDNLEIIVVIGGSNPHYECLQKEVADASLAISLQRNVNNMPELMAWADLAIAAGGSTNWELAFMGLPSLVITIADNQQAIAAELDRQGVIINLGWHQKLSIECLGLAIQDLIGDHLKRKTMSKKGMQLVDGNGVKRVVSAMTSMLT